MSELFGFAICCSAASGAAATTYELKASGTIELIPVVQSGQSIALDLGTLFSDRTWHLRMRATIASESVVPAEVKHLILGQRDYSARATAFAGSYRPISDPQYLQISFILSTIEISDLDQIVNDHLTQACAVDPSCDHTDVFSDFYQPEGSFSFGSEAGNGFSFEGGLPWQALVLQHITFGDDQIFDQSAYISLQPSAASLRAVPEPETWVMFGLGFGVTGAAFRRRASGMISS